MKPWEIITAAVVLLAALGGGIWLARTVAPEPVIGVVRFEAVIDFATAQQMIDLLEEARQDPRVAGVVVEILSPGGYATSSESIFYSMLQLRAEKPLVVAIDGMAVSGGYYMAAAGNRIYAPGSAYVGNIGSRGPRPTDPYIAPDELASGPFKLTGGSRFDRIHQFDLVKENFLQNVVHQRRNAEMNPLQASPEVLGEARFYLGSEAVALGLIDAEGGLSDAILAAAELAGVSSYSVVRLIDYLYGPPATLVYSDFAAAIQAMLQTAPPDVVFLLDSRMPLTGLGEDSAIDRHLMNLRRIAPARLDAFPDLQSSPNQTPGGGQLPVLSGSSLSQPGQPQPTQPGESTP
ncbi:MAG: S49 family peptidase [Litorilinea sp.]